MENEWVEVKFYETVADELLKFAVIISKYQGKWVFCKHRERDTYEVPGGHREPGEAILDTAKRELYEETGAVDFDIVPVCVYSVSGRVRAGEVVQEETFGMLFYADIRSLEEELHSEIEKIVIMDELAENWTYPLIQPKLIEEMERRRPGVGSGHWNRFFCYICCMVYFASYFTRINYAAVLLEIVQDLGITSEQASFAVLGNFVTYGAGQLVSGIIGDHIKPRTMIFTGLCITSAINLLMPMMSDIHVMAILWCFNGFAQSMLWPPLVRIMAERFDGEAYRRAINKVNISASVSTIAMYLLAPVVIGLSGWRLVFFVSAALGFATAFLWVRSVGADSSSAAAEEGDKKGAVENDHRQSGKTEKDSLWAGRDMKIFIGCVVCAIVLQGILRDGITTWMPTYINDVFALGSSMSILTAVVLPIFSVLSLSVTASLQKRIGNELGTAALLYGIALAVSLVLPVVFDTYVGISVISMAVITACMHGINLMLVSYLPQYFARYGKASSVSGFLNAWTYVGSAISSYGFAALSQRYGWYFTIVLWAVISAVGFCLCMLYRRRWKRLVV